MAEYSFDLHFHSCLSPCGSDDMTPANVAGLCALSGIQIAALTDHNSCENCEAFLTAAKHYGILGIPGMELTTAEEIHVVCLFKTLESAKDFSEYVRKKLPDIENKPALFGNQLVMDEEDRVLYENKALLSAPTSIKISQIQELMKSYDGYAFPAHIDRHSFSLINSLGAWDDSLGFNLAEISSEIPLNDVDFESLPDIPFIVNSDAHYINQIRDPHQNIEIEQFTVDSLLEKLRKI